LLGFKLTLTPFPKAGAPDGVMPGRDSANALLLSTAPSSKAPNAASDGLYFLIDI
jgi:hypothetical protein